MIIGIRNSIVLNAVYQILRNSLHSLSKPFIRPHSGGADRNLDDVANDRPSFTGDLDRLRWHRPGTSGDATLLSAFSLPAIGRAGGLPRNAGHGPGLFALDLNLTRPFRLSEHARLRPLVEIDNLLKSTPILSGRI